MKQPVALSVAHRLLAARPTCLLTVRYKGRVNIMPLGWACPVSMGPPLLALAIHPSHYTYGLLKASQEVVLNLPGRAQLELVQRYGSVSGADVDKVAITNLELEAGRRVDAPWIAACLGHLECAVVTLLEPGDHGIFVVEVVGAWAEEEAFDGVWLAPEDNEELHPLCHLGGDQYCLLGKRITP